MRNLKALVRGITAGAALLALSTAPAAAQTVDLGPSAAGCCDFGWRGYMFEAPTAMRITSLSLTNGSLNSELRVFRFNSFPPAFPSNSSDLTQIFYAASPTAATNITIAAGELIGIAGYDFSAAQTPYSAFFTGHVVSIMSSDVVLTRIGQQVLGEPTAVHSSSLELGAINFTYAGVASVPEPASVALLGLGLIGLVTTARRRRA